MRFDIVTLFPEMFAAINFGVVGRALTNKLINLACWNPRDFTQDNYSKVDDRPYGGGPGMVMMPEPLTEAVQAAKVANTQAVVVYLTPQGKLLDQSIVRQLASKSGLIIVAGRYEGVDERFIQSAIDFELSIGDYVVSGGELPAMVLIDAVTRLLPGVLGDEYSAASDSFSDGLLEYPQYTRPEKFADLAVPDILLSGNHESIARWRRKQALGRTYLRRRDLLVKCQLTAMDTMLLNEFIEENNLVEAKK